MIYENYNTEGILYVKSPSNRFTSKYVLYATDEANLDSELTVATRRNSTIDSEISIRAATQKDVSNSLKVMYRSNSDIDSSLEAIAISELSGTINIRPHNRAQGRFELVEAPRITVDLSPLADATTRSRIDLQTINYGDTQRMMIGHDTIESFEAFVNFGDLKTRIPDLTILEDAKLRLYYTGTIRNNAQIRLYQPETVWYEYGITYANKPKGTELLSELYTVNTAQKYVEIDVLHILKRWQDGTLFNYGLIIKSDDDQPIYFNTRESTKPPTLQVRYITSQVQSPGRLEMDSHLFVYQTGLKDVNSFLTVHSDRAVHELESSLYVHKYADPMFEWLNTNLSVTHPDLHSNLTVGIRMEDTLDSSITIIESRVSETDSTVSVSKPDLSSIITIDPKMSLVSEITIARRNYTDHEFQLAVSRPDLLSFMEVSRYTKGEGDLDSTISVSEGNHSDTDSLLLITHPDLTGYINVWSRDNSDLGSTIDIPRYDYFDSQITVSKPDLYCSLEVKYSSDQDSFIYIKERVYLDGVIDVRQFNDLESSIDIREFVEVDAELIVAKPELGGYLYPRVIGQHDTAGLISIRKRDVADLNSNLIIKGSSSGVYYFIM